VHKAPAPSASRVPASVCAALRLSRVDHRCRVVTPTIVAS